MLSGDICVANDFINTGRELHNTYKKFFQECSSEFPHVIYILGNHEHYRGDFPFTLDILRQNLSEFKNITILEKESVVINGVLFIGGTMWTSIDNADPLKMLEIKHYMTDFRVISNSSTEVTYKTTEQHGVVFRQRPAKFTPEDSVEDHKLFIDYLQKELSAHTVDKPTYKPIVVCTHHSPSYRSCSDEYINETVGNSAFHNNLDDMIIGYPEIKLWIHGHTHTKHDYTIGYTAVPTRVVCNPRGYLHRESIANTFELMVVEI